jgi:phage baseplate assembly protein V
MRDDDDLSGRIGNAAMYGRIASVDLKAGRVTVGAGDLETHPIRFFTGGAGGTRVWSRPKVDEQVLLLSPDGDMAGAIALRGVTSDAFPQIGDEDREIIQFEDGAIVAYDPAAHAMEIVLPGAATVKIVAAGGVELDSDVRITGKLEVDGEIHAKADVTAGTVSLQKHVHLGVQPGGGVSQAPRP